MKKSTIQTSLLDKPVQFTDIPTPLMDKRAGTFGRIRSVYTDDEGSPKYTVQEDSTGKLLDVYSCSFVVRGQS
jgi:hypothetical protein